MTMCNKKLFLFLFLSFISFTAIYGQKPKTDSIQEQEFGKIRADMVRDACKTFGYTNNEVINKINNTSINNFHNALSSDTANNAKNKWLWDAVGNAPPIRGCNVQQDKNKLEEYLSQIQTCCQEHRNEGIDTLDGSKYRRTIDNLAEECTCYRDCEKNENFDEYKEKYPKGRFMTLITSAKTASEQATVETSSQTDTVQNPDEPNVDSKNSPFSSKQVLLIVILGTVIGGAIVVGCVVGYRYLQEKKKQMNDTNKTPVPDPDPNPCPEPKPKPKPEPKPEGIQWVLVGASVTGNGHLQMGLPCQDYHRYESLENDWGIAIVSDGAGSAKHSDIGSKVLVERGIVHFKQLLENEGWMQSNKFPTDVEWLQKSYDTLKTIRNDVVMFAQSKNVAVKDLSATCLVVIYSPIGLLTVHVGDGRMGYENLSGEWKSIMTPHKGEEANQTIFLVSDFWTIPNFTLSGVLVPESVVVREQVKAFALMSDGCENTSWLCTAKNEETGKYYDRNTPFDGFFKPLKETIISLSVSNVPEEERNEKWHNFIESGTDGFRKEQDDKTMIYGMNLSIEKNA